MKTYIRRIVNSVGKIKGISGPASVFGKCIKTLPQPDVIPLTYPAGQVVSVKIRLPGQHLMDIKTSQWKHPLLKLKKNRLFYFFFSGNIANHRNIYPLFL